MTKDAKNGSILIEKQLKAENKFDMIYFERNQLTFWEVYA